MFVFAWAGRLTRAAAYTPSPSSRPLSRAGWRISSSSRSAWIPAQVIGTLTGVRLIKAVFPSIGSGPRLNVGIHHGALTEGFLTFMIVVISLMLKKRDPTSFFMRTWISNLSKVTLHILGSNLTGGIMNPASAFGWAYARGDHITIEHLLVYWLAPLQATLLGVWTFKFLTEPSNMRAKSE